MIVRELDFPDSCEQLQSSDPVSLRHRVSELTEIEEYSSPSQRTVYPPKGNMDYGASDRNVFRESLYHLPVTAAVMSGKTTNKPSDAAGAISFVHRMISTLV